jgi:Putative zinc-finger
MNDHGIRLRSIHEVISTLMPWYVNGTISELDRQKVDSHLRACAACREELLQERCVYEGVGTEVEVGYISRPSLKRLNVVLDGIAAGAQRLRAPPRAERRSPRSMPRTGLMAASVAALGLAVGLLVADRWTQLRAQQQQSDYYTVTTAVARPPDEVVRAVFAPNVTLVELKAILDEAQLKIVSGPSEAGVYSLAATSGRPVNVSLGLLRQHATVRFAERTSPAVEISASSVAQVR